jgi:hypothetical protein
VNETPAPPQPSLVRRLRVAVIVLAAIAIGLVAWAAIGGDGDDESANGDAVEARIVSAAELESIAADAEAPLYWAGERPGAELEYDEAGDRAFVRYLTGGAEAGDPRPAFLTIATYPLENPADALRANARRTNTRLQRAPGGALVWVNPDRPQSVYLAEPGSTHQVEVYDPLPRRALSVALSGDVVPVG